MTCEKQTRSLHYFHTYAVRDRIDLSSFSDEQQIPNIKSIQLDNLLPSASDEKSMRANFSVLVSRVLVKHLPSIAKLGKHALERHITYQFSQEMAMKSEVVSYKLG